MFAFLALAGCASTGPPRPPSLYLPQIVRDLSAQRSGSKVVLHFTVPTLSTDRQSLAAGKHGAGNLTAQLCRQAQPAASACTPVNTVAVLPGQAMQLQDSLPPQLQTGAAQVVAYRVSVLNGQGRSAGVSREAVALAGAAPEPLRGLAATTTARGVQLTWVPQPVSSGDTHILLRTMPGGGTLAVPGDPGGTVDASPKAGDTLTYTVLRTRTIPASQVGTAADLAMNGEPASITVTRAADTFAPMAPTGLAAVALQLPQAAAEIDLSWEPNTEPDLAGYLLYRSDSSGPATLITPSPVSSISFRDGAVQAGHTYSYTLRAIDNTGNRSAASAPATETVRP